MPDCVYPHPPIRHGEATCPLRTVMGIADRMESALMAIRDEDCLTCLFHRSIPWLWAGSVNYLRDVQQVARVALEGKL